MKKMAIIGAIAAVILIAVAAAVIHRIRSGRPEALLERLVYGKGDRDELIMKLNVIRGDVVTPMIEILQDPAAPAAGRADVLELLCKRNFRTTSARIEEAILAAAKDPNPIVRRKAAQGIATYGGEELQISLADTIKDPDPECRRQAYLIFGANANVLAPDAGVWKFLSEAQKQTMIQDCRRQVDKEQDPKMRLLARAVLGREIEIRSQEAIRALQTSDVFRSEQILKSTLELDPENRQAQIRLIRFYLKNGGEELALDLARKHHALIEIPQLSKAPEIDGDPTDPVWEEGYQTETFYMTTSRWVGRRTEGKSKACVGHHNGSIYIAILGYEEDLDKLITKNRGRDGSVWRDDCVEIIFDPGSTGKDYYQFVINAVGALFDQANRQRGRNFKCRWASKIFRDRGYWACEFTIDGQELDKHLIKPGVIWSMLLCRTRIGPASELGAIWPVFGLTHRMYLYPLAIFLGPQKEHQPSTTQPSTMQAS